MGCSNELRLLLLWVLPRAVRSYAGLVSPDFPPLDNIARHRGWTCPERTRLWLAKKASILFSYFSTARQCSNAGGLLTSAHHSGGLNSKRKVKMKKPHVVRFLGRDFKCLIKTDRYQAGGIAVFLVEEDSGGEEPLEWVISVNLPETNSLPDGAFYVKHWSENEEVVRGLVAGGVLVPADVPDVASGRVMVKAYRLAKETE